MVIHHLTSVEEKSEEERGSKSMCSLSSSSSCLSVAVTDDDDDYIPERRGPTELSLSPFSFLLFSSLVCLCRTSSMRRSN